MRKGEDNSLLLCRILELILVHLAIKRAYDVCITHHDFYKVILSVHFFLIVIVNKDRLQNFKVHLQKEVSAVFLWHSFVFLHGSGGMPHATDIGNSPIRHHHIRVLH